MSAHSQLITHWNEWILVTTLGYTHYTLWQSLSIVCDVEVPHLYSHVARMWGIWVLIGKVASINRNPEVALLLEIYLIAWNGWKPWRSMCIRYLHFMDLISFTHLTDCFTSNKPGQNAPQRSWMAPNVPEWWIVVGCNWALVEIGHCVNIVLAECYIVFIMSFC